jgi:hypothetical protein
MREGLQRKDVVYRQLLRQPQFYFKNKLYTNEIQTLLFIPDYPHYFMFG